MQTFAAATIKATSELAVANDETSIDAASDALLQAVEKIVNLISYANFVRLVPEMTRAACHRGEAYLVTHKELVPREASLIDQPIVSRLPSPRWSEPHQMMV